MSKQKGQINFVVDYALGIAVFVILVSFVVLPQIYAPTVSSTGQTASGTNSFTFVNQSAGLASQYTTFSGLTRASGTPTVKLTWTERGADYANVTDSKGTVIGTLYASGSYVVNVTANTFSSSVVLLNYTANNTVAQTNGAGNVSALTLTYTAAAQSSTWDTNTATLWLTLAIATVIGVLVYIFTGLRR